MEKLTKEQLKRVCWVCLDCGKQYSKRKPFLLSTFHTGICDICKKEKAITQARDFHYFE